MSENIPAADVCKLFGYDAGNLIWLPRPELGRSWNTKHAGKIAGTVNPQGYRTILIDRRPYKAHRLIWAFFHKEWPAGPLDHINGNPSDNHISNLRSVTVAENGRNQARRRDSTSGITGVYYRTHIKKWVARIRAEGRDIHLGVFETRDEARAARLAAQRLHGYHENHGRAS